MGKPDLPEKRPPEGGASYLLTQKVAEIYEKGQGKG